MVTVQVDFEAISRGQVLFKCPSELDLDDSHQHLIHRTISKYLIDSQSDSEEKQRLESVIDFKLAIDFDLANIRQDPSIVNFEVAEKILQC